MTTERDLSRPIRVREVIVNDSDEPIAHRLREIPVEPLTDYRIASLPLAERAKMLQDRQQAYSRPQLERKFHHELDHVDPTTLRLAVAIVDIKDKQTEFNEIHDQRGAVKADYEAEKQAIRRGERGGRRVELKVQEATALWQRKDEDLAKEESARRVLRDTVTDIFIRDLFLQDNGLEKFLLATEDLVSQSSFTRQDVVVLLQQTSLRLRNRERHENASFFAYKEGTNNFIRAQDAKKLQQVVEMAFSDPPSNNPVTWQLKQVAIDSLDFYWKNCESLFGIEEKTPRLAFIHDIFYAACLTGDLKIVKQVINHVWGKLESGGILTQIEKEYERAGILASEVLSTIVEEIEKDHRYLLPSSPEDTFFLSVDREYLEKWNPEKRQCILEKYFDRIGDFNLISMLASSLSDKRRYFFEWYPQQQRKMGLPYIIYSQYMVGFDFIMGNAFPSTLHLSSLIQDFVSEKQEAERYQMRAHRTLIIPRSTEERQKLYAEGRDVRNSMYAELREDFKSNEVIFLLFSTLGIEDVREMGDISGQNNALFRKIRDENLWFVAENGDQYGIHSNNELSNFSIKTLTFYPHSTTGGWKVEIATELVDENGNPINCRYYLDREGQFFLNSGIKLKAPAWLKLPFERLILERLHFITSGVLGQREHHVLGQGDETREQEGRRSHWRTLTSTPERMYTLTSHAAKRHADYVLETYGIDIYKENLHRRSVGTLGANECVTFVKAVPKQTKEPNQIVFDSSLLDQVA